MAYLSTNSSDLWKSFKLVPPVSTAGDAPPAGGAQYSLFSIDSHHQDHVLEDDLEEELEEEQPLETIPKRIIICCDGTWQSSVNGRQDIPSNATRLARSIARTGTIKRKKDPNTQEDEEVTCQQVVYYSSGIGTGGGTSLIENLRQATFGDGLVTEVIKAYNFVVMNYAPGDQVCCFGFSRGAYTARSVAGLITDIGIIQPKEMDDFPVLYKIYREHHDNYPFRESQAYREWVTGKFKGGEQIQKSHRLPPESSRVIEVVGVFDTVGALGIPGLGWAQRLLNFIVHRFPVSGIDYQGFHNTSISNYTKHAFHALALDEHMKPFAPTLWHLPTEVEKKKDYKQLLESYETLESRPMSPKERRKHAESRFRALIHRKTVAATEDELKKAWGNVVKAHVTAEPKDFEPELLQVWFPGGHVNIGGGNATMLADFSYDFEQIALITFAWMCDQISPLIQLDDGRVKGQPADFSRLAHREIQARRHLIDRLEQERYSGLFGPLRRAWGLAVSPMHRASKPSKDNRRDDTWATGDTIDVFKILGGFLFLRVIVFFLKFLPFVYTERAPGHYKDPTGDGSDVTNERIHPSVYYRMSERPDYTPKTLEPFPRPQKGGNNVQPKWKSKEISIPGYVIRAEDRISRHLVEHSRAKEFMAPLMERRENGKLLY
ncbi:hypothetical protein LZ32DRAFT_681462 [Colletotrichum eremochloae]|nr:hypothetical protein LZ32DRAFT_681462 [Colletotrichum eremochloae]